MIDIIDTKIKEHQIEIDGCKTELEKLRSDMKNKDKMSDKKLFAKTIQKATALTNKNIYHQGASDALKNLKTEMEGNNGKTNTETN